MAEAKRGDWKTQEMPAQNAPFPIQMDLTPEELALLRQGHVPRGMEDKWFRCFVDGVFYIYRSWTGFCIYQIPVSPEGRIRGGIVNRDPDQYKETDSGRDAVMAEYLIRCQVGRTDNRELMMKYIRWGKGTEQ